jgi:hypothetical protein
MEKDITILELIKQLKSIMDFTLLEIVDYWEADFCAIGLKKGDKLIYISTFNYVGNNELNYDFDLEIINGNSTENLNVIKEGRNVSEAELVNQIKQFLDV